jgi:hypothetical protein
MSTQTTVVSAKLPVTLATRVEDLAQSKRLTTSLLLRQLLEAAVETSREEQVGPIEATTRARLEQILDAEAFDPRASVACELARRLDVDPSNGAQHSRELMRLLDDLESDARSSDRPPTVLDEVHARRVLKAAGYGITEPSGEVLTEPDPSVKSALLVRRERDRERRGRVMARLAADD